MIKLINKSEWLELPSPLAEPKIKWTYDYGYQIERVVRSDGEIIWFGEGVNWKKEKDGPWTVLGQDPAVEYRLCPEEKTIWIPCEEPIYETLYKELNGNKI